MMIYILTTVFLMAVQFFLAGLMFTLTLQAIVEKEGWKTILRDIVILIVFLLPGIINALEVIVTW